MKTTEAGNNQSFSLITPTCGREERIQECDVCVALAQPVRPFSQVGRFVDQPEQLAV